MSTENSIKKILILIAALCLCQGSFAQDEDFSDVDFGSGEVFEDTNAPDAPSEDFGDVDFNDEDFKDEDFSDVETEDTKITEDPIEQPVEPLVEEAAPPVEPEEKLSEDPFGEDDMFAEPAPEPSVEPLTDPNLEVPTESFQEDAFASTPSPDEPNLEYEMRLHQIYNQYYSKKTSDEDWNSLIGARQAERYTIERGDNLWGISKTLFGDGNYWPKVWSLNSAITNPHLINPENNIRFVLGDESGPPVFTVTESTEEASEPAAAVAEKDEAEYDRPANEAEPEIPQPLVRSRPVVKRLPPSLPIWQDTTKQGQYDDFGIDYGKRKITEIQDVVPLAGYVVEESLNALGEIHEVEMGSTIASALQYVYVLIDPGTAQVGDTLLVIKNLGEVQSAHPSITGFLGYSIEIQGEVQLVERLPDSDSKGGRDVYRAIVSKIVNPVTVGSSLVKGKVEYVKLSETGPRSQVVAQIVGGQYFNLRQVYGTESVAYINRGTNDGLAVGDILSVRENRMIRNPDTAVRSNVRPIGWLKVVKATANFATTIVVRAWSDILTGDVTGAGNFQVRKIPDSIPGDTQQDTSSRSLLDELDGE